MQLPQRVAMERTPTVSHHTKTRSSTVSSGPTCHFSGDAALAEAIATLRELEIVAFQLSRNSAAGLYFAQHRLLLMRLNLGKAPSRSDWLALAALGEKAAAEKAA